MMAAIRLIQPHSSASGTLADRSDDELMRLAQAGSREGFEVLVQRHAIRIINLCSRFVNDAHLGQELAQDTWVMVWKHRESYREHGGVLVWIITVARNQCRNQLRHKKTVERHLPQLALDTPAASQQIDELLVEERRRQVRLALAELPAAMREALLLRYAEELRYDEMTAVVGTGESTLRSRVHHGLKLLKHRLEDGS